MKDTKYIIETSQDGVKWKHQAGWREGDNSRFNQPFNDEIAIQEVISFKAARGSDFKHIRLIINVK